MNKKNLAVTTFALFSLFFGAGNLILPPQLGFKSGGLWPWVTLGFCISAVLIPILGIWAHSKLQGTMYDFAKKVSPRFSLVYCYLVYAISIALPSPRTASVTHEMAIQPIWDSSSLLTSLVYFSLVYLFVVNRSKILDVVGKWLTPAILTILLLLVVMAIFGQDLQFGVSQFNSPLSHGLLEGYQTFDAIGAVVVGGVIIISINLKQEDAPYETKRKLIAQAGFFAGIGLLLVYGGLILTGALFNGAFEQEISRTALLNGISIQTLGNNATFLLSVLVSLACFTTAVGIVTGTADFIKGRFDNSNLAYRITAVIGCLLGVLVGQFNVGYIIAVALPALMFIYPITIVLILLNVLPSRWASPQVFQWVVITTILFSVPDFLATIGLGEFLGSFTKWVPLSELHLGWLLPMFAVFILANVSLSGNLPIEKIIVNHLAVFISMSLLLFIFSELIISQFASGAFNYVEYWIGLLIFGTFFLFIVITVLCLTKIISRKKS